MMAQERGQPVALVVMGVCASGKSTIGNALSERLGVPFIEGDALHARASIAKMSRGVALEESDRLPWLHAVVADADRVVAGAEVASGVAVAAVITCSALRRAYRGVLRGIAARVVFVHLAIDEAVAEERVRGRVGHFMPSALVRSQFECLEDPAEEKDVIVVDARDSTADVVSRLEEEIANRFYTKNRKT